MVKKIFLFFSIALILLCIILFIAEDMKRNPKNIVNNVIEKSELTGKNLFEKGRTFVLRIYYMGFLPVGTATLKVDNKVDFDNKDIYLLTANAKLTNFLSKIYYVKAQIKSMMDISNQYSLKYTENLQTKEKVKIKEIFYDQKNHIAKRADEKVKILPNTQDPLSAIFYLLANEYKKGDSFSLNLVSKEENYEFKVGVEGKTNNIWKLKIEVARQDRSSTHGGRFYFWVYDGKFKIPLSIKAWIQAGLITARLIDAK